jgi:hypothetical protein
VPAIELKGCTTSQDSVARMMTAMRQISGVQRVSLSSSEKGEGSGGAGCSADSPVFSMTVFFKAPAGAAAPAADQAAAAGAAPAASTSTTASAAKGTTP